MLQCRLGDFIVKTAGKLKSITEQSRRDSKQNAPPTIVLKVAPHRALALQCEILFMTAKWKASGIRRGEEKRWKIYYHNAENNNSMVADRTKRHRA